MPPAGRALAVHHRGRSHLFPTLMPLRFALAALTAVLLVLPATAQPGAPDATFGAAGVVRTPGFVPQRLAVQADGAVLAAGFTEAGPVVRRFLATGTPDVQFGTAGEVRLPAAPGFSVSGLAALPNGYVVIVGGTFDEDTFLSSMVAMRLTPSGGLDPGFGDGGVYGLGGYFLFVGASVDVTPSGGFVLAAGVVQDFELALQVRAFTASGAPDAAFGTAGVATVRSSPDRFPFLSTVAVDAGGRIYLAGTFSTDTGGYELFALRLLASGGQDPSFGGGMVTTPTPSDFAVALGADVDASGRLVVAGYESFGDSDASGMVAARYTETGALDATFGAGGLFQWRGPSSAYATSVAPLVDGGVALAGGLGELVDESGDAVVVRLDAAGRFDSAFGAEGVARLGQGIASTISALPDGRLLAAYSDEEGGAISRLMGGSATAGEADPAAPALALTLAGPNPTRGATAVHITLDAPAPMRASLVDALGRTVAVLLDGTAREGDVIAVPVAGLAPGRYVVRAEAGGQRAMLPLTVVR